MHGASFLNRALNSRCTVITDLDTSKRSTQNPFPAATPSWKLAPRPRIKHEKRTAGSAWNTWTVAAADGVRCARVRWETNSMLPFETVPFFCVYPICCGSSDNTWQQQYSYSLWTLQWNSRLINRKNIDTRNPAGSVWARLSPRR